MAAIGANLAPIGLEILSSPAPHAPDAPETAATATTVTSTDAQPSQWWVHRQDNCKILDTSFPKQNKMFACKR
jgi:hypothetical protein